MTDHQGRAGDWWVRWTDAATGKEHREKAGSRPAALDLYSRRRADVRKGAHFPESMRKLRGLTMQDLVDDYTAALALDKPDPREQSKTRLAEVVAILADVDPKTATPEDIERLKARLAETPARGRKDPKDPKKERPRSAGSVNRYLQDLRSAFNLAKRNGKVDRNPVADVRLLRENNFAKAVKRAGISDLHVHDTRHTFACRLLRAGVDIYTVSKLLRHASVVMSERCAHLSQNDLKVAVERKSMLQTGTE